MDLWAFGVSPYGLHLSDAQFWFLSMREFRALKKVWRQRQEFQIDLYAELQVSLHNLWSSGKRYTAADFNGKSSQKKAGQTWQQNASNFTAYAQAFGGKDYSFLPKDDKEQVVSKWLRRAYEHREGLREKHGDPPPPVQLPSMNDLIPMRQ